MTEIHPGKWQILRKAKFKFGFKKCHSNDIFFPGETGFMIVISRNLRNMFGKELKEPAFENI